MDALESAHCVVVHVRERACLRTLRASRVTAATGTSTSRGEQLSVLTEQPRHLLQGSPAPQPCSTLPPLTPKSQSLFHQQLANSPGFVFYSTSEKPEVPNPLCLGEEDEQQEAANDVAL